jgi:nicotinamide mononucleotide adenylyltransferase
VYLGITLDFIKKRVRQFQEKKLNEILSKIQFHQHMKNQLKQKLEGVTNNDNTAKIREEIKFNDKMIEIWQRNEEKLRRQMSEMED